jgi:hypothetical protein
MKKRKIIELDELPDGFFYFTDTHIVVGTGKFKEKEHEDERVHSEKRKCVVFHGRCREGCPYWKTETENAIGL